MARRGAKRKLLARVTCGCGKPAMQQVKAGVAYFRRECQRCYLRRLGRPNSGRRYHVKDYCQACGWKPLSRMALDVDHIVPRAAGGSNRATNLQTLCPNCHRIKTLRDAGLITTALQEVAL